MPKIYTKRQREHALHIIREVDDYNIASTILNIPASTLRNWWSEYKNSTMFDCRYRPVKSPAADYITSAADAPTLVQIRDKLSQQLDKLITSPTDDPRQAYFAALAVRSLLEQIKTINRDMDIDIDVDGAQ